MNPRTIPPRSSATEREIRDMDGSALHTMGGSRDTTAANAAGHLEKLRLLQSDVTVDGLVIHAGMDVKLVVCRPCRRGRAATWWRKAEAPLHGLCTQDNAVRCAAPGCGVWACPRHAYLDPLGRGWLCRDCRPGCVRRLIYALLWTREE